MSRNTQGSLADTGLTVLEEMGVGEFRTWFESLSRGKRSEFLTHVSTARVHIQRAKRIVKDLGLREKDNPLLDYMDRLG